MSTPPEQDFAVCEGEGYAKLHVRCIAKRHRAALCGYPGGIDVGGNAMVRWVVSAYFKNDQVAQDAVCWRCAELLHKAMAKVIAFQPNLPGTGGKV